ncbi:MAG: phospholipase D-like domain-containing protein [Gammaproteobacteria bacterium]|nr:phospholipase D-like domain-containing protein [Gammaproteobacteria bacterium]
MCGSSAHRLFCLLIARMKILYAHQTSPHDQSSTASFQVFWGGPDCPARYLRDLLEERIHAVPPGGEILWVTYYFRDEGLAAALLQARCRGVRVRVVMETNPRNGDLNHRVRQLLQGDDALGKGLRCLTHRKFDNLLLKRGRLHEKLYYFSHPAPGALVGTFNPSGNIPEDPEIIRDIGDQDRGHNVLVEICDSTLVAGLYRHARRVFEARHGPWESLLPQSNRVLESGKTRIIFFPRSRWGAFNAMFDDLDSGSRLRMAVSHLNDRRICQRLFDLARCGVFIEILAHDTQRRVPAWVEQQMLDSGITFNRYIHPEGLPMHNKFMLFEAAEKRTVAFGSMNLSQRSLHANHELLVIDETPGLYDLFRRRWDEMLLEVNDFQTRSKSQRGIS